MFDNADDVGELRLTNEEILFIGDYVNLTVNYLDVAKLDRKNCGWRGFWIYGSWIIISFVNSINDFTGIKFFIRGRKTILSTRRTANKVFERLKNKI